VRRVIVTEFVSLDGVMEAPGGEPTHPHSGWTMQFGGAEQMKYKLDEVLDADALLLGRVTYEGFAAAWPGRTDEAGFADKMNSMPKYVVSSTLGHPEWENTRVISLSEVPALKEQDGGDIIVAGSATLVQALIENDLVDEYRLMIFPVLIGTGKRVFADVERPSKVVLELTDSKAFESGVVVQTYRPAREG
jgi:dihydrofolate reductase